MLGIVPSKCLNKNVFVIKSHCKSKTEAIVVSKCLNSKIHVSKKPSCHQFSMMRESS